MNRPTPEEVREFLLREIEAATRAFIHEHATPPVLQAGAERTYQAIKEAVARGANPAILRVAVRWRFDWTRREARTAFEIGWDDTECREAWEEIFPTWVNGELARWEVWTS